LSISTWGGRFLFYFYNVKNVILFNLVFVHICVYVIYVVRVSQSFNNAQKFEKNIAIVEKKIIAQMHFSNIFL
jgi:hypothetical protein